MRKVSNPIETGARKGVGSSQKGNLGSQEHTKRDPILLAIKEKTT
jgi:hypothetical protein